MYAWLSLINQGKDKTFNDVSQFEGIRMLEDETFNEFYIKLNDIRNSMINHGKNVLNVKLIKKIMRFLPERFRIKVTTVEKGKDLDIMKI
jgi:hypothetical protein